MKLPNGDLVLRTLLVAICACAGSAIRADEPLSPEQKAKAIQNTKLAIDLARQSLEKREFIETVQLSDLADRCAQATGDKEFLEKTRAITDEIRAKCPADKVEEARTVIRDLTAGRIEPGSTMPVKIVPTDPNRKKNTEFTIARGALVLPGPIEFETGGDAIKKESEPSLFVIFDFLEARPLITTLRIEGHIGSDGDPAKNQALSERRAATVATWLVAHGVDPKRLLPVGFGSTKPIAPNDTPSNKAANSRIEIHTAAMRGKLIGGAPADGGGKVAQGWGK